MFLQWTTFKEHGYKWRNSLLIGLLASHIGCLVPLLSWILGLDSKHIIIPYPLYSPNYTLWRACSLLRFALHLPPVCHLIVYSLGQLISNHSLRDKTASTLLLHCAVRTTRIQCSSFLCFFF